MLIVYSLFDFVIPLIVRPIVSFESPAVWLVLLNDAQQLEGCVFYAVFYFFMLINAFIPVKIKKLNSWALNVTKFKYVSIVVLTVWFAKIMIEFNLAGGPMEWFASKALMRWSGSLEGGVSVPFYLDYIKWDYVLAYFAFVSYLYWEDVGDSRVLKYLLPGAALVAALMTFFRGAILNLMMGYIFLFLVRLRNGAGGNIVEVINIKRLLFLVIAVFAIFIAVGGLRSSFEQSVKGDVHNNGDVVNLLTQGSGLTSVTNIVNFYPRNSEFMHGKTYIDMMLLPVPRLIYSSKPEWYGVDDITRKMGWPESTQSAVTMPGEAYANFGWFGLFLAPIYGYLFLFITRKIASGNPAWILWYSTIGVGAIGILNWMAFTGLINQILTSFILSIFWILIRRKGCIND
jgi:oligosaccharide repeat unit polymerase